MSKRYRFRHEKMKMTGKNQSGTSPRCEWIMLRHHLIVGGETQPCAAQRIDSSKGKSILAPPAHCTADENEGGSAVAKFSHYVKEMFYLFGIAVNATIFFIKQIRSSRSQLSITGF